MRYELIVWIAALSFSMAIAGCEANSGGETGPESSDATGADVSDASGVDCEVRADGGCECAYQGRTRGVCGRATFDRELERCSEPENYETSETSCADGVDNDCDGETDCEDADCTGENCGVGEGTARCTGGTCEELVCHDGVDNDGDGRTDCADSDCIGRTCVEEGRRECPPPEEYEPDEEMTCDDGIDNDCDGATDETCGCTFDPNEPQGVDTDGSRDAGVCTGQTQDDNGTCPRPDAFEFKERSCADGIDNDCDGKTDCEDINCINQACGEGKGGAICTASGCREIRCYDGVDNDQDGTTDCADTDGDCIGRRCEQASARVCPAPSDVGKDGPTNCDGIDNDCDGATDKGCPCTYDPNEPNNTDTDGDFDHGVCANQTKDADAVCQKPSEFIRRSAPELCDSLDHDCDGVTDEGCPCNYMGTATGVCSDGTVGSNGNCQPPLNFDSPDESTCDGLDNDCDGDTDEGCDDDGDGYCDGDFACPGGANCLCGDCYDDNADAKPPQQTYFGNDRSDGSFDYNCDGNETKKWTKTYTTGCPNNRRSDCNKNSREGWDQSNPPDCGKTAYWNRCRWDYVDGSNPCKNKGSFRTQKCL